MSNPAETDCAVMDKILNILSPKHDKKGLNFKKECPKVNQFIYILLINML